MPPRRRRIELFKKVSLKYRLKDRLRDFRENINTEIYGKNAGYGIGFHYKQSEELWKKEGQKALGAVLTFLFAPSRILDDLKISKADVVLTCNSDQSFIFTTAKSSASGYHPVSGSRAFGVYEEKGKIFFFTKAADAITKDHTMSISSNTKGHTMSISSKFIFSQGGRVWEGLLSNIDGSKNHCPKQGYESPHCFTKGTVFCYRGKKEDFYDQGGGFSRSLSSTSVKFLEGKKCAELVILKRIKIY